MKDGRTQADAARLFGITQPCLSDLMRSKDRPVFAQRHDGHGDHRRTGASRHAQEAEGATQEGYRQAGRCLTTIAWIISHSGEFGFQYPADPALCNAMRLLFNLDRYRHVTERVNIQYPNANIFFSQIEGMPAESNRGNERGIKNKSATESAHLPVY